MRTLSENRQESARRRARTSVIFDFEVIAIFLVVKTMGPTILNDSQEKGSRRGTACRAPTADFARRAGKNKAHPEGWALVKVSFDAIRTRMYRGTSRGGPIRSSSRRGDCRDRRFPRPPPASRGSGWPRAADKKSLRYGRAGRGSDSARGDSRQVSSLQRGQTMAVRIDRKTDG